MDWAQGPHDLWKASGRGGGGDMILLSLLMMTACSLYREIRITISSAEYDLLFRWSTGDNLREFGKRSTRELHHEEGPGFTNNLYYMVFSRGPIWNTLHIQQHRLRTWTTSVIMPTQGELYKPSRSD